MKYKWLNKEGNDRLILFFNGWGMDEKIVNHLSFTGFDVVMFYDYRNLNTDFDFSLTYPEKYLISWSMGVMVSSLFCKDIMYSVAINGTLLPINKDFGINPKIYDLTVKNFNEKSKDKFVKSMFEENETHPDKLTRNDSAEELKQELEFLKSVKPCETFTFNKVIISDNDKIIPSKNQINYWNKVLTIKGGHCPFFKYKSWGEFL